MVLRNEQLIKILQQYDKDLPIIIFKDGKCQDHTINDSDVAIVDGAYFGNDYNDTSEFDDDKKFLRIAVI